MMLDDLKCPTCRKVGTVYAVSAREELGKRDIQDVRYDIELACESCGYGQTVVDTFQSPLQWLRAIFEFLPTEGGSAVRVEEDDETGYPKTFDHDGQHYEVAEVLMAVHVQKPGPAALKMTCFLIEVEGGEVVLRREEGIPTDKGDQTVWFMTCSDLRRAVPRPLLSLSPSPTKLTAWRAQKAYGELYRIETLLRNAIKDRFPDAEALFKSISARDAGGKDTSLLKKLQSAKEKEQSQSLRYIEYPLVQYMEWTDLIRLIDQKWVDLFPGKSGAKNSFLQKLQDLRDVRNKIAHMRGADLEDLDLLKRSLDELGRLFPQARESLH